MFYCVALSLGALWLCFSVIGLFVVCFVITLVLFVLVGFDLLCWWVALWVVWLLVLFTVVRVLILVYVLV